MTLHVLHEDADVGILHVVSPQKILDNDLQLAGSQPCSLRGPDERKGYLAVCRNPHGTIQFGGLEDGDLYQVLRTDPIIVCGSVRAAARKPQHLLEPPVVFFRGLRPGSCRSSTLDCAVRRLWLLGSPNSRKNRRGGHHHQQKTYERTSAGRNHRLTFLYGRLAPRIVRGVAKLNCR